MKIHEIPIGYDYELFVEITKEVLDGDTDKGASWHHLVPKEICSPSESDPYFEFEQNEVDMLVTGEHGLGTVISRAFLFGIEVGMRYRQRKSTK